MKRRRTAIVAGNWKMNFDHLEATLFVQKLAWMLKDVHFDFKKCEVAIMPSFTSLRSVQVLIESENIPIKYGAQTVSVTSQGAFTGDVSADMLAALGCSYVIVGHSERRKYHPENDANLVDQVRAVLAAGMKPVLCVGESLSERREGIELEFAVGQVNEVARDLSSEEASQMLVAYEPLWAIGTGMTATSTSAQEACKAIREYFDNTYGGETAEKIKVLYGGSVNSSNAAQLLSDCADMDGFLVGGASLDVEEFASIVRITQKLAGSFR